MELTALLQALHDREVRVVANGDRLRVTAPPGALTPELKEALTRHKAALLAALGSGPDRPELRTGDQSEPARLSHTQERIWLFQELDPGATTYNILQRLRLRGPLDADRLGEALRRVVGRHEALRSVVAEGPSGPCQKVVEVPQELLRITDLSGLPPSERESEASRIVEAARAQAFDLASEIALRPLLVRLEPEVHDFVCVYHHLWVDGSSLDVVRAELGLLYAGEDLPDLPVQYADYLRWERASWEGASAESEAEFWRRYLDGAPSTLALPTDRPRPPAQTFAGGTATAQVDGRVSAALERLGRSEQTSLFSQLLVAFGSALHRMSGQRDLLIGTPVAGRNREEFQGLVGMFVNQLPMRMRLANGATYRELLREARDASTSALSHAELPFALLLDAVGPDRDPSRSPLFQAVLNLVPVSTKGGGTVSGLTIEPPPGTEIQVTTDVEAKYDLTLYAQPTDGTVRLLLLYNADLYAPERAQALLEHVVEVLDAGVTTPDAPLEDSVLGVRGTPARLQMAGRVIGRGEDESPEEGILQRLRSVATEHGDRPAIVTENATLSYTEVHARAALLAETLLEAAPDDRSPVGVFVGHDETLAPAILGVLETGRPYVPLDVRFPPDRLAHMVREAGISTVVVSRRTAEGARVALGATHRFVQVPEAAGPTRRPALDVPPDDIAYLLFTSGSTGVPKAVFQSHENLLRQCERYASAADLRPDDRVALLASASFDAFLMDFFGALISGAALYPFDLGSLDLSSLPAACNQLGITVLHTTPTVLRTVAAAVPDARFESVRFVDLGGEAVRRDDVAYFDGHFGPDAVLMNSYGPSEHTFALGYPVPRDLFEHSTEVPIGWPVGDVDVVLVDRDGREDPVSGEVVLCSRFGARGYWRQPLLTERSFFTDEARPGKTLYRTGDIARRRPDGAYVFLGRADDQLKIRGHRVEPGEVESTIVEHERVVEVAVYADAQRSSLTACVVVNQDADVSDEDLASWCRDRLPAYMVPNVWIRLPTLPRTPTGKVDRRALPSAPSGARVAEAVVQEGERFLARFWADALGRSVEDVMDEMNRRRVAEPRLEFVGTARVPPRDAAEEVVAEIWSDVLGRSVDSIGVYDDFFDLGGQSLSATQAVARVRDALGVDLALRTFFEQPTIAATVEHVRAGGTDGPRAPPITSGTDGPAPLAFSQERMWVLQQLAPHDTAYNIGIALLLAGPLDVDRLVRSIESVVERHDSLRTRIHLVEGRPVQVVVPLEEDSILVEDLTHHDVDDRVPEVRKLLGRIIDRPFHLQDGPVIRATIIRLADETHVLGIGVHHAVFDLWSAGLLIEDLSATYDDARPTPARAELQYRDFAAWQRQWLSGEELEREVRYWRERLEGIEPLDLPTDFVRPPVQTFAGRRVVAPFRPGLVDDIEQLARECRTTSFSVLLAAYNVLLMAHSGQTDLAVGVPIAGRTHEELEPLIGTFVNTLVHRNDLSGDPSFRELVGRVRGTALDAFAHQDVPFHALVRELETRRDPSRSPLFQVLFNLANEPELRPRFPGVRAEPIPGARESTQFDLMMAVTLEGERSGVSLAYNTDLFAHETGRRLLNHYLEILDRVVSAPDAPLDHVASASTGDLALLNRWNSTDASLEGALTVCEALNATADRSPDKVAVCTTRGDWTYAHLRNDAQRVTALLVDMGIGPGDRVVIMMERSHEMLAALIGVMGAGAAYVPVDPTYPEARVRYVIASAEASVMIVDRRGEVPPPDGVTVLESADWREVLPVPFRELDRSQAAYAIYTSGSTGEPKGVEVPHRAVVNFLRRMAAEPGITEDDVLLAVTTISFDIAVLELYLPLLVGARLVIADEADVVDARRLVAKMETERVSVMQATPATWKLLIAAGWEGAPGLRVLCGGEPLPRTLADELIPRVGELWNMYGPTETTVWSTIERVEADGPILIGRPIGNTTLYVTDGDLRRVPIGVPGELWIGGEGVANGYVGRPDLTAERFIDSPFREGERIYRTGDLVRFQSDGRLQHLGRLDHQVKVRGFRIELGEIEAVLRRHAGVRDAVVVASEDRLVAYIIYDLDSPTTSQIRTWVAESLPAYMMPSYFVSMDAFPHTPNGKVDRNALPDPAGGTPDRETFRAPVEPEEVMMAQVWSELLGLDRISALDNFFELGGHSLLAMEAVARVEQHTGQRMDPRALFFKTLEQLASSLNEVGPA